MPKPNRRERRRRKYRPNQQAAPPWAAVPNRIVFVVDKPTKCGHEHDWSPEEERDG